MRPLLIIIIFTTLTSVLAAEKSTCYTCHFEIEAEGQPAHLFKNDIHNQDGLTCASCHGGDPTAQDMEVAMSPENGYIGVPGREEIPKFCSSCHSDANYMKKFNPNIQTDQYEQYLTSQHGQLLKEGDPKVATCIDCHSVHNIRKVNSFNSPVYDQNVPQTCAKCHSDDKYMSDYHIPTDQYQLYQESIHGKKLLEEGDRGAPACNDCHGNHGAVPPGVQSIGLVCGTCHSYNMDLYQNSPKQAIFRQMGLPACESCHGNHEVNKTSDAMLGVSKKAVCSNCHDDPGSESYQTIMTMRSLVDSLRHQAAITDSLLEKADEAGMEVSDAQFDFNKVNNALVKSRSLIHAFELDTLRGEIKRGLKKNEDVHQYAVSALGEIDYRRTGLLVALVFILLLIGGIYLKVKQVDRKYGVK